MTVPTSDNREQYLGNDSATEFDYAFKIFNADDLVVILTGSDDSETTLVRGSDYSVGGVGEEAGGSVTYPLSGDPLATGEKLTILREIPLVQETDLRNQGAYYPETIEDELDRSRMIDQQQEEVLGRTLKKTQAGDNFNAGGLRIVNLGDSVADSDALTQGQMKAYYAETREILEEAQNALANAGYIFLGDYSAGIKITSYNQVVRDTSGEFWRASGSTALPYTTTGAGMPEGGSFVSVGDAALRQEFSEGEAQVSSSTGLESIKSALDRRLIRIDSISDLLQLPVGVLSDGQQFSVMGYNPGTTTGGGLFYWDAGSTESADDVNIFGAFTSGRFKRLNPALSLNNAGADPTGETASDEALDRVLAALPEISGLVRSKHPIKFGSGRYVFNAGGHTVTRDKGYVLRIEGAGEACTQIDYYGSETYFLDFPSENITVSDLALLNRNATRDKRFLRQRLDDGRADIDAVFRNCLAVNWEYVHHCYGRGSVNIDCTLQGEAWALIESPDPFTAGPEANVQSVKTGMRRYVSSNLMVDSAVAVFKFSENGPAAEYINEVTIDGIQGNTLSTLVIGGYINNMAVRTGSLVRSFTLGLVRAFRIKNFVCDVSAVRGYDPDETPSESTRINYALLMTLPPGEASSFVQLENVDIKGLIGNLGNGLILCEGRIGNININLMCPNAFESSTVSGASLVSAAGGISPGAKVNIDNIAFSGSQFAPSTFAWVGPNIPDNAVNIGSYCAGNVPVPLKVANRGVATIPDGASQISFAHGLGFTPALEDIQISPMGNPNAKGTHWWVDAVSASNILIRTSTAGAGTLTFAWAVNRAKA